MHVPGADVDRSSFGDVIADEMKKRARTGQNNKKGKDKAEKFKF